MKKSQVVRYKTHEIKGKGTTVTTTTCKREEERGK